MFLEGETFPNATDEIRRKFSQQLIKAGDVSIRAGELEFLDLLKFSRRKLASDPRDKVYGILGLTPHWIANTMKPDYNQSCASVYLSVFLEYIATTGDLDIMLNCDIDSRLVASPSWVPSWTSTSEPVCIDSTIAYGKCSAIVTCEAPNLLKMAGTFIGTVKHVSRPLPADKLEFGRVINEFESQYCRINGNKTYANVDTLMATLVRGRLKDRRAHFEYYPNLQNLREIYQGRHFGNLIRSLPYEPIGKALLATAEGYIGMVNTSAEVGEYPKTSCLVFESDTDIL